MISIEQTSSTNLKQRRDSDWVYYSAVCMPEVGNCVLTHNNMLALLRPHLMYIMQRQVCRDMLRHLQTIRMHHSD